MVAHRVVSSIAALAAALPAAAPDSFRLLPLGFFRAIDGRPKGIDGWMLSEDDAAAIAADIAALDRDLPIDYEHQIINAASNGQPAPAAGWIGRVAVRSDGEAPGLWAEDVTWTERARAMIEAGEYRYISPVFEYDPKTGRVLRLVMATLTNHPGLDGLTDLQPMREDTMDEQVAALRAADDGPAPDALKARDGEIAQLRAELEALRTASVPMAEHARLHDELAALRAQVESEARGRLIEAALADGRILPAQRTYWEQQPMAALRAWLDVAQPIAALTGQQSDHVAHTPGQALSAEQEHLCRIAGWTPETFKE